MFDISVSTDADRLLIYPAGAAPGGGADARPDSVSLLWRHQLMADPTLQIFLSAFAGLFTIVLAFVTDPPDDFARTLQAAAERFGLIRRPAPPETAPKPPAATAAAADQASDIT